MKPTQANAKKPELAKSLFVMRIPFDMSLVRC